jgi:integrase
MAIYQRGKSYYYDFVYKGQRYTGCIGPVSRTVAKEELARKKAEVVEGRLNPVKARKTPRFDTFAEEYLEWVKANKKPLTYRRVGAVMKRLAPTFGAKRLNDITAWQIEQYKKTRREEGNASATVNLDLCFLKALLNKAIAWNKLAEYPAKHVKLLKVTNERTRFLSEEEEAAILAACSPPLRWIVEAGLLTGFRPRELASLRPEDVDLTRNLVTVAACYAKTGESRTIPMGERLRVVIQEALAQRGDAPTVFTTVKGKPWRPASFGMVFCGACVRAGITPCGPHTLRHTFASRLIMAGVDLRTVQELLGHKTISMTLRYAHLSPDHKRQAIATLEQRFSAEKSHQFSQQTPNVVEALDGEIVVLRKVSGI